MFGFFSPLPIAAPLLFTSGVNHVLSGQIDGVGSASATLVANRVVSGTCAGTGTLTLSVVCDRTLGGTAAGVGDCSAAVVVDRALAGSVAGLGDLAGTLTLDGALSGSLDGIATLSADLVVDYTLSGSIDGVATLVEELPRPGFEHYIGRVVASYRAAVAETGYGARLTESGYVGRLADSDYRGVLDLEGDEMFEMVVDDRSPSLTATLKNAETGVAVDLTSASSVSVKFRIDGGSWKTGTGTIVTAADGIVRYDWAADDLDTAGVCELRFIVVFSGKNQTFPSSGYFSFPVNP